jgi:hypothetical protein
VPSAKQLSWLLVREPGDLEPREHELVQRICQDDEAARVAGVGLAFCRLVRRATGRTPQRGSILPAFDVWLTEARACRNAVVANFARNLGQDAPAIRAALTLPWSNGQSEGQINRLKLLKRSMYGRAGLDLLRRRFLIRS